jgi:hypothetical protein
MGEYSSTVVSVLFLSSFEAVSRREGKEFDMGEYSSTSDDAELQRYKVMSQ